MRTQLRNLFVSYVRTSTVIFICAQHKRVLLVSTALMIAGVFGSATQAQTSDKNPAPALPPAKDCTQNCRTKLGGQVLDKSHVKSVLIEPNVEQEEPVNTGDIPFSISVDGVPLDKSTNPASPDKAKITEHGKLPNWQRRTDVGLSSVDIQVKFDGLDIRPTLNISTTPVRRAFHIGDEVRFLATSNYPAFIEHSEIRIYEYIEKQSREKTEPIAVIPVSINGEASWTMGKAEDDDGRFKYILRVYDAQGRYDETLPRTLARTERELPPEDKGKISDAPAPGMGEDNTKLRNIQINGGSVTVYGRNVPEGYQVRTLNDVAPIDRNHAFVLQRILPPGEHNVDVAVLGSLKGSALKFNRQINIPQNDWFYIGLADMTIGKRTGDDGIEDVRPDEYDKIYTNGRLAYYVKGKIKGKYLLTSSADTGEGKLKDMFRGLNDKDAQYLLRRIKPDDYYPVYGDDSTAIQDAPTNGKFYVRLERGDSHVMWGNYKTAITGTEFIRSERMLYGGSAVYRSEETTPFGERETEVNLYAAQPDTLPQRDQFLGTGGSAYFMKRQDIVVGSDTVSVEYRDPISGQVIERKILAYGQDYTLDYMQGVLILKYPLSSTSGTNSPVREQALGGNKAFLIVQYEYTPTVGEVHGYVYGGRAQKWFNDTVRFGITGMSEETGLADQQAYGADVKIRKSDKTFLEAEVARSEGPGFGLSRSTDGGLTISDTDPVGARGKSALAWRMRGQADLQEVFSGPLKGMVGGYYDQKDAGFATLSNQTSVDQRSWGLNTDVEMTPTVDINLTYDDYQEGRDYDPFYKRERGGRSKRKGEAIASKQLNEYWKSSFGVSYTELNSPIARLSGKTGYDGDRLDIGTRLEYAPDDDQKYYAFAQGTVKRSGDIDRNNRGGVGAKYRLTEKITLEGEASYGNTGFGALGGIIYSPTAEDSYYISYRLDPDRAFDIDRLYDLSGSDRGTLVIGARRKLNDMLSAYAENNYDLFGRRDSVTKTYGVIYTPDKVWSFDGAIGAEAVEDDGIDPYTGLERSDFDRKSVSLSGSYKDDERGITGRTRGEVIVERSDDNTRDRNAYLFASGLSWKTNKNWRLLTNINAVISDSQSASSFRDGSYVEASFGYAYRPVENDRLNALFMYKWVYDQPGEYQVSAITGEKYGPAQRSHILSVDVIYDLLPWLSVGGKYGFRYGDVRQRLLNEDRQKFSDWYQSSAHLGILRTDLTIVKNWDILLEGRIMYQPEAKTTDYGTVVAIYRSIGDNFKIGAGYNFGKFSDDLRDLTLDDKGLFLNVIGKF